MITNNMRMERWAMNKLSEAVDSENVDSVREALADPNVDVNEYHKSSWSLENGIGVFQDEILSPLMRAVKNDNGAILQLLVDDARVDVNLCLDDTVLTDAVQYGCLNSLKVLLECERVDVNLIDLEDLDSAGLPICVAAMDGKLEALRLLM